MRARQATTYRQYEIFGSNADALSAGRRTYLPRVRNFISELELTRREHYRAVMAAGCCDRRSGRRANEFIVALSRAAAADALLRDEMRA